MRRKQIVVASLILSAIVISGVVFFFLQSTREPVYQGKPLSVWLKGYDTSNMEELFKNNGAKLHELDKIVSQVGTNAIPTLLRLLREEDLDTTKIQMDKKRQMDFEFWEPMPKMQSQR
jgi:hypothetical protein